jgi:hypothetical protein
MPELDLTKASNPLPIKYTRSCYSFSDPGNPSNSFLFELVLNFNDGFSTTINKLEKSSRCECIIDIDDKIFYEDINNFSVYVAKIPFSNENIFNMEGKIDHDLSSYTQKDDSFYIEFSKNDSGFTNCNCYFIGHDYQSLSISPPF